MPDSFKIGDLVVLKSAGPKMTVTHTEGGHSGIIITTAWFAGSKSEGGRFPVDALVIAPPDQKSKRPYTRLWRTKRPSKARE